MIALRERFMGGSRSVGIGVCSAMGVIGLVLAIGPNWSRCAMRSKLAVLADCYRSMSGLLSLLGTYTSL